MNQSFAISVGQFLSFLALGIGVGLYFCGEAIVRECKRWGKWREARRLVRQAEATEAMKRYRAVKCIQNAATREAQRRGREDTMRPSTNT